MNKKIIFACLASLMFSGKTIAKSHSTSEEPTKLELSQKGHKHKVKKANSKKHGKSSTKGLVKWVKVFDAHGTSYWVKKTSLHAKNNDKSKDVKKAKKSKKSLKNV